MSAPVSDWGPVILALGSFISATAGAIVVLYNAFRSKRMEAKLDAADVVQEKIHVAVNGGMAEAKAEIAALKLEIQRLTGLRP